MEVIVAPLVKLALGKEHGGAGRVRHLLRHRARALMRKGYKKEVAYAIANEMNQRQGLQKKDSTDLTKKGIKYELKHEREKQ